MYAHENILPCVVFAFNRPDKLERVLAALKTQDIDRLIVFVDGPRDDADVELVKRCMDIAKDIDWVDKELHYGMQNRGLPGLSDNISTVLNIYHAAVFVEDDCLPMSGFYSFMRQALSHYESEKKVFSIGGYQPILQRHFKDYSYSLVSSNVFLCWGWATWQDRWKLITPCLPRYRELFDGLKNVSGDVTRPWLENMAQSSDSWDVKVAISMLWLGQVQLLPTRGLVQNIGQDGSGVHGGSLENGNSKHNKNLYRHSIKKSVWLENIEPNSDYAKRMNQFIQCHGEPPRRMPWHKEKTMRKIRQILGFVLRVVSNWCLSLESKMGKPHTTGSMFSLCDVAETVYIHPGAHLQIVGDLKDRIKIGERSCFSGSIVLETHWSRVSIGDQCSISCTIISAEEVIIGSDVLIAGGTLIQDHNSHSIVWEERKDDVLIHRSQVLGIDEGISRQKDWSVVKRSPIIIKDKVWIGGQVMILKGVTIGEGAVIGAGSVVTHDVEPWTVVAGNPAKKVKTIQHK